MGASLLSFSASIPGLGSNSKAVWIKNATFVELNELFLKLRSRFSGDRKIEDSVVKDALDEFCKNMREVQKEKEKDQKYQDRFLYDSAAETFTIRMMSASPFLSGTAKSVLEIMGKFWKAFMELPATDDAEADLKALNEILEDFSGDIESKVLDPYVVNS